MVALDETGSLTAFGRRTGGVAGDGSEGPTGVLALFLAGGFLVTSFVVEDEGPAAGEGGWAFDVEGGSYRSTFHKSMVPPQSEEPKSTCVATGDGITVDKSRTTVLRLLVFDDSAGGGFDGPVSSVDGSTRRSTGSTDVESLPAPGCFLFFFFCV